MVNIQNVHWVAIVKYVDRLWWLDSFSVPTVITEPTYRNLIQQHAMSFAIVADDIEEVALLPIQAELGCHDGDRPGCRDCVRHYSWEVCLAFLSPA